MKKEEPTHGYCTVCNGPIPKGVQWTMTEQLNRVHASPDDCIEVLHPEVTAAFKEANPLYKSKYRYNNLGRYDIRRSRL